MTYVRGNVLDMEEIRKAVPEVDEKMKAIAELRQFADDNAIITNNGRIAGGAGGMKIMARVPAEVVMYAEAHHGDIWTGMTEKEFSRWLKDNPWFAAYTGAK